MANPLMYTYRRCPYAMRARMAVLVAGVACDACEIQLRDKPAELLALSPKGTVPVLHLPDGSVIEESWGIMRWALSTLDQDGCWSRVHIPGNKASQSDSKMPLIPVTTVPVIPIQKRNPWVLTSPKTNGSNRLKAVS
ncbi:glutaredoxin [Rhodoferax antarcticus]|nr:glutaredoxin [Rhodoferax antarcticus]